MEVAPGPEVEAFSFGYPFVETDGHFRYVWDHRLQQGALTKGIWTIHAYAEYGDQNLKLSGNTKPGVGSGTSKSIQILVIRSPRPGSGVTSGYWENSRLITVPLIGNLTTGPQQQNRLGLARPPGGDSGPHLAYDFAGTADQPIVAAEDGKVQNGEFVPLAVVDSMIPYDETRKIWTWMREWCDTHGLQNLQNPLEALWVEFNLRESQRLSGKLYNERFILGPHRKIDHGTVYHRLKDPDAVERYETSLLTTAYCHVATPVDANGIDRGAGDPLGPDAGTDVKRGQLVARVGKINENSMLSRGYFVEPVSVVDIYRRLPNGAPNPQMLLRRIELPNVNWPSSTAEHVHFEVRLNSKENSFRRHGEQNPGEWIGIYQ